MKKPPQMTVTAAGLRRLLDDLNATVLFEYLDIRTSPKPGHFVVQLTRGQVRTIKQRVTFSTLAERYDF